MFASFGVSLCLIVATCFALLISNSAAADSSQCVNSTLNCSKLCFPVVPPSNTYLVTGQKMNFSVESLSSILFYFLVKDGDVISNSECGPPENCVLDSDSPRLEITSFNQSISAGAYRFGIQAGTSQSAQLCPFYFNISQGVAPTIMKETNPQMTLDADTGKLELNPIINHGTPPGVVQWTKDGVVILNNTDSLIGSVPVQANDRGLYRATVSNEVGSDFVEYEIRVNFSPIITLITNPVDTHPNFVTNGLTVTCEAIAYPQINSISLTSMGNSITTSTQLSNVLEPGDLHYQASATYNVPSGCPTQSITCSAGTIFSSAQSTISICQLTPVIESINIEDERSSNVSAHLSWVVDLMGSSISAIDSFEVRYRIVGDVEYTNRTINDVSSRAISITGLSPGVTYEFSVKLVDMSANTEDIFFDAFIWTTFRRPVNRPTGVNVDGNESSIILKWNKPFGVFEYAPIAGYKVSYSIDSSTSSSDVFISGSDTTQFILSPYNQDATYAFIVWATNDWGEGDMSAPVQYKYNKVDPEPLRFDATLTVAVGDDMVVFSWDIKSEVDELLRLEIIIRRLQNNGSSVVFYPVTTINVSSVDITERCFSELNSSETYQFCLRAHRKDSYNLVPVCEFATTSNQAVRLPGATMCHPVVEPEPLSSDPVIPSWAIAVLVVGCVALVFIFFGGCGLYFGLRRNKKGDLEFDDTPEGFDSMSPSSLNNGKYPYPPPNHQRASSPPSRNCMSYHRNDRGHHMDWQGVSHV